MADFQTSTIQQIEQLIGAGQFDAALPLGKKLVEQAPNIAAGWYWLGQVQLLRGELPMASSCFQQAVRLETNNALYWTNAAIALLGLGKLPEAEKCARQAAQLDPNSETVWINLGSTLFQQNQWVGAASAYQRAVSLAPENAIAWKNLATAEMRLDHLEAAQAAFERGLTISPDPDSALNYALLLLRLNKPQHAAHILQQIVDQVPDLPLAWHAWGDVQTMLNQPVEAEKAYRRVLENEPQNHAAQLGLALSLLTQFRVSEAAVVARELVQALPKRRSLGDAGRNRTSGCQYSRGPEGLSESR